VQEWCVAAFERLEIEGFIIGGALLPTPIEDADPFEGQGAHSRLMRLTLVALLLILDLCPEGMSGRFRCPLDKRLSQELWTLEAPVDTGLLAAAFRHRCNARIFLEFLGGGKAFPLFAEGDEEAGSKHGPSPWQGVKQREVGMALSTLDDDAVEVSNPLQGDPELGDEGVHEEDIGGDDTVIGRQRSGALDGLDAGSNQVSRAHVVGTEEAFQSGAACELGRFEGGPAAEEVAKDRGIFLGKPLQNLWKGVFERTGQAVGQTDFVADQATAMLDELRQGAHGGALGVEWGELVAMFQEDVNQEFGIGGVIFGPARGKCFAVRSHGERIDGKEHEEIVVLQRRHNGAFIEFQADGNRLAIEPCAQGADPRVDHFRPVFETQEFPARRTGDL
jgi:hypothetical protein